jgi:hypothetical protein
MDWTVWITAAAVVAHALAYLIYLWQVWRRQSVPNASTWLAWIFIAALGVATYQGMTNDWLKTAPLVAAAVGCTTVTAIAASMRLFKRLEPWDWIALAVSVGAAIIWVATRDATRANLFLQLSAVASFTPTLRALTRRDPAKKISEKSPAWLVWSLAYALNNAVVLCRWTGHWPDIVGPLVDFIGHATIAATVVALVHVNRRRQRPRRQT